MSVVDQPVKDAIRQAISLVLTPLVAALLYKVSPRDPAIFAGAFVAMAIASLAASFAPAWRAARIDPVQALRDWWRIDDTRTGPLGKRPSGC
jgi:ABC-type lipoprotein release transport system permease subunit